MANNDENLTSLEIKEISIKLPKSYLRKYKDNNGKSTFWLTVGHRTCGTTDPLSSSNWNWRECGIDLSVVDMEEKEETML